MSYYFLPFSFFNSSIKGQVLSVNRSTTSIDEGVGSVTFTVTTSGFPTGTTLYYTISGTNITAGDFTSNSLSGSFTITNNQGSFVLAASADLVTEGPESFVVQIRSVSISGEVLGTSGSVNINDISGPTGMFFGGQISGGTGATRRLTRINVNGAMIGSEIVTTSISSADNNASNSVGVCGAKLGSGAGFFNQSLGRILNASGTTIAQSTSTFFSYTNAAGVPIGGYALTYAGSQNDLITNSVFRTNTSLSRVGSETQVGTRRYSVAGGLAVNNAIFVGGIDSNYSAVRTLTRINSSGAIVGSESTNVAVLRYGAAGANIGSNAVFWGGTDGTFGTSVSTVERINDNGAKAGGDTSISQQGRYPGAASVLTIAIFYGGSPAFTPTNNCIRIDGNGNKVGATTSLGTARELLAGAGI